MEKEIKEQLNIANKLILETSTDQIFKISSPTNTMKKAWQDYSEDIDLKMASLPSIKFNEVLLNKMLKGLLTNLMQLNVSSNKIQISTEATTDGVKIILSLDKADLSNLSLLHVPIEIITAFLICYHHSGMLEIDTSSGLTYEIRLPSDPENTELPMPDTDWLDDIFSRFENWSD